jgi:Na+/proline symporter
MLTPLVIAGAIFVILGTALAAKRPVSVEGFFQGSQSRGQAPGLWTLVLSQVTTWIFARSLLNSAILGYYYGVAGSLAYTAYYLSFLTGGVFVARLRQGAHHSVQDWLRENFGAVGSVTYNVIIALRLLSEVFANLLVVGLIFSVLMPDFDNIKTMSIVLVAVSTLIYSAWGGLQASLKTDVIQMVLFAIVFAIAFLYMVFLPSFQWSAILTSGGVAGAHNGWILLLVAFLQVPSYPLHDPVMMDRGFLSDDETSRRSFFHAFWIASLFIFAFGLLGIYAAEAGAKIENDLLGTWTTLFPAPVTAALMISLLISGVSTLDSALASAARLMVEEFRVLPRTLAGGRVAMIAFLTLGSALTLWGNATLFDAVAVSGTASMFLTPIAVLGLFFGLRIALWSYVVGFGAAMFGAIIYFARASAWASQLLPDAHKYTQLLVICICVLGVGFVAAFLGASRVASKEKG